MLSKSLLVVLLLFCIGLLVESRIVDVDLSDETDSKEVGERYGSVFKRKRRSTEETSSEDSNDSDHLTSAEAAKLVKLFSTLAWNENKEDYLASLIEEFADSDSNITIIGWQKVYDAKGNVKESKGIEFVVPSKPDDDEIGNFLEDDDEEDWGTDGVPHEKVRELREILKPFEVFNIDAAVFYVDFDEEEKTNYELFIDQNELYIDSNDFILYDRIINDATPETYLKVTEFAKKYTHHAILPFSSELELNKEQAVIDPYILGEVSELYEVPDEITVKASTLFTDVILTHWKDNVPKYLVESFSKAFPQYTWRSIANPKTAHITHDLSLALKFDVFSFKDDMDYYHVYGTKINV